jgi:hypothetical protein
VHLGGSVLPVAIRHDFERWVAGLAPRVREGRSVAERDIAAGLESHLNRNILPQVDELVRSGNWRGARDLLTFAPRARAAEAGVSVRGFSDADLARATEGLRTRLDERRAVLDEAWAALDLELRSWVESRVAALRSRLDDRTVRDVAEQLRSDWENELRMRRLSVDNMPLGVPRFSYEALAKASQELADLERELADEDAQLRFSELEEHTGPLWKERRFGEIARAMEAAAAEPWSSNLRARITLVAREARLLEDLLARAAKGARDLDGQLVTLPLGTFSFSGRLRAGLDPLAQGFRLQPERGQELAFTFKSPSVEASLLPGVALEMLAGLSRMDSVEPSARLVLALFRWRDGDGSVESATASQAALDAGTLPSAEPLVADLERRVLQTLSRAQKPEGERRARAEEKLRLVRRESLEPGSREKKLERITNLLTFEKDLLPGELAELRSRRDTLVREGTPSTIEDFEKAFLLPRDRIQFPGGRPRAVLRFDLGQEAAGTFDRGSWTADGVGWVAPRYARNDEELLSLPGPTLVLKDPLRPQSDSLEISLVVEQLPDSPPDLLLVSVAGFHVILTSGVPPRCLVETGDAFQALAHARAGQGKPCEGLRRGRRHTLRILVNRNGGRAEVTLDDKTLNMSLLMKPVGDAAALELGVRSFEPVRVVSATVEAARR